jgi:prepilin-type N-terminal cleavage/methylation domain-containing protein
MKTTHAPAARERGFTLIEIMVAAAIASIVIGSLFGAMLMQQQGYMAQMDLSEASQNARASLDIIKANLRTAGWGMVATTGARGISAVGTCFNTTIANQSICDEQLALNNTGSSTQKSDMMRLYGITGGPTFSRATTWSGGNKLVVTDSTPSTRVPLVVNDLAIISGQCNDTSTVYNGVVQITGVSTSAPQTTYTFNPDLTAKFYPAFTCASMKDGFAFGLAHIVEFYIDRGTPNPDKSAGATQYVPTLMMLTNRGGRDPTTNQLPTPQIVAYDIEDLQVRYGLDCGVVPVGNTCATATSPSADDIIDKVTAGSQWCNDMQAANCNTSLAVLENPQRIMAVQVAVVPRTRSLTRRVINDELSIQNGPPLTVFNSIVPADGYKHWIYRATVALRNNQLAVTAP